MAWELEYLHSTPVMTCCVTLGKMQIAFLVLKESSSSYVLESHEIVMLT